MKQVKGKVIEQPAEAPLEEPKALMLIQPKDLMQHAQSVADVCRDIVKKTAVQIRSKRYVQVEGWQAIAATYGFVAGVSKVERLETGWNATSELRSVKDGTLIATAEGFVGDDEKWGAEYACRAKAQTRAMSRVCRSAFAFVVVLIDKDLAVTPSDEISHEAEPEHRHNRSGESTPLKSADDANIRAAGLKALRKFLADAGITESFVMELCHTGKLAEASDKKLDDLKDGVISRLNSNRYRDTIVERWNAKRKETPKGDGAVKLVREPLIPTSMNVVKAAKPGAWRNVAIKRGANKDVLLGALTVKQLKTYIKDWKPKKVKGKEYDAGELAMDAALTLAAQELAE